MESTDQQKIAEYVKACHDQAHKRYFEIQKILDAEHPEWFVPANLFYQGS